MSMPPPKPSPNVPDAPASAEPARADAALAAFRNACLVAWRRGLAAGIRLVPAAVTEASLVTLRLDDAAFRAVGGPDGLLALERLLPAPASEHRFRPPADAPADRWGRPLAPGVVHGEACLLADFFRLDTGVLPAWFVLDANPNWAAPVGLEPWRLGHPGRGQAAVADDVPAEPPPAALRDFRLLGLCWLTGGLPNAALRDAVVRVHGDAAVRRTLALVASAGSARLWSECQRAAKWLLPLELEERWALLREVWEFADSLETAVTERRDRLVALAGLVGVPEDRLWPLLAEYLDPPFADHAFPQGLAIEVWFDGEWQAGTVVESLPSGERRVRLLPGGQTLLLHPRADLLRPAA